MTVATVKRGAPAPKTLRDRLHDETLGIRPGANLGSGLDKTHESTPATELADLGVPLQIRRQFQALAESRAEYGTLKSEATKKCEELSDQLKELMAEYVPDDIPAVMAGMVRLTRFTSNRPSFDKDACKRKLLDLGVPAHKVKEAFDTATTTKPVISLKVTGPGEDE